MLQWRLLQLSLQLQEVSKIAVVAAQSGFVRSRKKFSTEDFMKNLLLNDVNDLNWEYRCDVGFQNAL